MSAGFFGNHTFAHATLFASRACRCAHFGAANFGNFSFIRFLHNFLIKDKRGKKACPFKFAELLLAIAFCLRAVMSRTPSVFLLLISLALFFWIMTLTRFLLAAMLRILAFFLTVVRVMLTFRIVIITVHMKLLFKRKNTLFRFRALLGSILVSS